MPSLHLIQNQTDPKLLPRPEKPGAEMWISGYWSLSVDTVKSLVDGRVYFHRAQAKPGFLGGTITGFHIADEPPYADRIILVFRPEPAAKGVITSRTGWSMEKKIVSNPAKS